VKPPLTHVPSLLPCISVLLFLAILCSRLSFFLLQVNLTSSSLLCFLSSSPLLSSPFLFGQVIMIRHPGAFIDSLIRSAFLISPPSLGFFFSSRSSVSRYFSSPLCCVALRCAARTGGSTSTTSSISPL
jgi:hypothetical protein